MDLSKKCETTGPVNVEAGGGWDEIEELTGINTGFGATGSITKARAARVTSTRSDLLFIGPMKWCDD